MYREVNAKRLYLLLYSIALRTILLSPLVMILNILLDTYKKNGMK